MAWTLWGRDRDSRGVAGAWPCGGSGARIQSARGGGSGGWCGLRGSAGRGGGLGMKVQRPVGGIREDGPEAVEQCPEVDEGGGR